MIDLRKIDCLRCGGQHEAGDCPTAVLPPPPVSVYDAPLKELNEALKTLERIHEQPIHNNTPFVMAQALAIIDAMLEIAKRHNTLINTPCK